MKKITLSVVVATGAFGLAATPSLATVSVSGVWHGPVPAPGPCCHGPLPPVHPGWPVVPQPRPPVLGVVVIPGGPMGVVVAP